MHAVLAPGKVCNTLGWLPAVPSAGSQAEQQ
jgi:hypothetical protein